MSILHTDDTIAAISSPPGGGIGIVRLSGTDAFAIAARVWRGQRNWEDRHVYYGKIMDGADTADEVLLIAMRAPRTYTTEDTVEINCHGGVRAMQTVLRLLLANGARLAEPGEFTKRAFLHGRIDLSQAEAVLDVISAQTALSHKAALSQLDGRLAKQAKRLTAHLLQALTRIEAAIDYPEYDETAVTIPQIREDAQAALAIADKLLQTADSGRILRDGLETVIIGRPNVGKSSLLNALLNEDRAIVTDIPGTTRDTLSEFASIGGIPLRLTDTAGLRHTDDEVERIGVERSRQHAAAAELLLYVIDGAAPLCSEDIQALQAYAAKQTTVFAILNKQDKGIQTDRAAIAAIVGDENVLTISAKEETGLQALAGRVQDRFCQNQAQSQGMGVEGTVFLTNTRHIDALTRAQAALANALATIDNGLPEDFIAIDIRTAYDAAGEITGETADGDLLDSIFSQFCLGK